MRGTIAIIGRECRNFLGSDKQLFVMYGILSVFYSFIFAYNSTDTGKLSSIIWWIFFSIITSGTFSNSVFVAERITGSLEILLTAGFSREAILLGKVGFLVIASLLLSVIPLGLSLAMAPLLPGNQITGSVLWQGFVLYCFAVLLNSSCAAWMSIKLGNPRLLHFISMLILLLSVGVYAFADKHLWAPVVFMLLVSAFFMRSAQRAFHSEKVVQPVNL
jgi:ABC-type transport system involved in multi-copper enzyme maturation permease subunit